MYAFPLGRACTIAVAEVRRALTAHATLAQVRFVRFSEEGFEHCTAAVQALD